MNRRTVLGLLVALFWRKPVDRTIIIRTREPNVSEGDAYRVGMLPRLGSRLEGKPYLTLKSYSFERVGKHMFRIDARYA